MSNDALFQSISADIAAGKVEGVSAKLLSAAESTDDPFEVIKCMSILKLVPNEGTETKLANKLVEMADEKNGLDIAKALYNLDCPYFSLKILEKVPESDEIVRLRCHCLCDMEEFESALDMYKKIKVQCINDRIMLTSVLSSLGEHKRSMEEASALLAENPKDYDTRIAYVKSLMMGGKNKEALLYARSGLKDKTADSNAVAAYVLRIQGNIKAAGGYASRAVQINNQHIGGMESLGICLALKGEYEKARIVAGAINEISPGDKAAINVLSYCEGQ